MDINFLSDPPRGAWVLVGQNRHAPLWGYISVVLIAMSVRVVVGLILKCAFIAGGEVAVAIWALAGWGLLS